jgi:8-oxo-dGTP pyrophosphatase MutT (NUDIX family)
MNQSQIQAVVVIIEKDGKFLLGKRSPQKRAAPLYWCPITGKIEPGESEESAVEREVLEEVGLVVKAKLKITEVDSRDKKIRLHWWSVDILQGDASLKNDEHTDLGWFTVEEMGQLEPIFQEDLELFITLTQSGTKK